MLHLYRNVKYIITIAKKDHMRIILPSVYLIARGFESDLYLGVSSNLQQRIWQHKNGYFKGWALKHGCKDLVYYEVHDTMEQAIIREKKLKKWRREWKVALIARDNPDWNDLYKSIL